MIHVHAHSNDVSCFTTLLSPVDARPRIILKCVVSTRVDGRKRFRRQPFSLRQTVDHAMRRLTRRISYTTTTASQIRENMKQHGGCCRCHNDMAFARKQFLAPAVVFVEIHMARRGQSLALDAMRAVVHPSILYKEEGSTQEQVHPISLSGTVSCARWKSHVHLSILYPDWSRTSNR